MADNLIIGSAATPGGTVATDECTINSVLVHVPLGKLGFGVDGTYTGVSTGAGSALPVQGTVAVSGGTTTISGTVPVSMAQAAPGYIAGTVAVSNLTQATPGYVGGTVTIANASIEIANDSGNAVPISIAQASPGYIAGSVTVLNQTQASPGYMAGTVNVNGTLPVSLTQTGTVVVSTLPAVSGTVATSGTVLVQGNVASAATDSGNPVKIGGVVTNVGTAPFTNGQRADGMFDLLGRSVVAPYAIPENFLGSVSANVTSTTAQTIIAAQTGLRIYATTLILANSDPSGSAIIDIRDGNAGTIISVPAPAGMGGAVITLPVPVRTSVGSALQASARATSGTTVVSAVGYRAP